LSGQWSAALRLGAAGVLLSSRSIPSWAEAPLAAPTALPVYTSPRHDFEFAYAAMLVNCAVHSTDTGDRAAWAPSPSCQSAICEDADVPLASTLACIAYPQSEFSRKPAFGGGGNPSNAPSGELTIAGKPAAAFRSVDHWMMHARIAVIDRVFHARRCYELGIQRLAVNTATFDAGSFEEFTARDEAKVQQALGQALQTLRFLH